MAFNLHPAAAGDNRVVCVLNSNTSCHAIPGVGWALLLFDRTEQAMILITPARMMDSPARFKPDSHRKWSSKWGKVHRSQRSEISGQAQATVPVIGAARSGRLGVPGSPPPPVAGQVTSIIPCSS